MNDLSNKRIVIVGIFVLIGLVLLTLGILLIGDLSNSFEKKIMVVSLFDDVGGLKKGNNIWQSGVKVGIVSDLSFYDKSKVIVSMDIDVKSQPFIANDSKVKISSDGFIGNKILVIYGGSPDADPIQDGDTLMTEKTFSSEDVLNTLQKNNENLLAITDDFKSLTHNLASGEGTIGKLLTDESIYTNLNATTVSLQQAVKKVQDLTSTMNAFSKNLNKEGTLINDLTTDTTVFKSFQASIAQLQNISDTASFIIANVKREMNDSTSTLGILVNDRQTGNQVKETIKNLESSSKKLDEDLEALQHSFPLKSYFKKKTKKSE